MSVFEEKIIIRLPRFSWRFFFNLRTAVVFALLVLSSVTAYWYHYVRPFFWISNARVEAFSTVLSSDMSGRIVEIGPKEGDFVRKGQSLLCLDRDLIFAKQIQAKRLFDSLNDQLEAEKARIGMSMDSYLTATSEMEFGIGSEDKVKRHLSSMEEAQEKSEKISLQLIEARAVLADLDLQVKKMTLAAPFDGLILKRSKNQGAVISFGEPIFVLCDPNQTWIEAEIPEQQVGSVVIGSPAKVRLTAYPGKEFAGRVAWIGPATVAKSSFSPLANQKEAIPIKISLENADFSPKPGLSAQVGLKVH